ncbi:hypothetical protein BLNAU_20242 [Blattamonas nauphoetae]|uniref:Uncharacterized protein n=1 Tax=Blattamonas nauphoetae TaxID=2049346 RepID=A0ABQ9X0H3_9EUKA|nr:hypothetical protein BLNAU_20242 [Blattamonas nauphoetae]
MILSSGEYHCIHQREETKPSCGLIGTSVEEEKTRGTSDWNCLQMDADCGENGRAKGSCEREQVAPIEGKAKAALSKRKTAAKIVTSNQPSGEEKGANEPAAEEKKESDEKEMETVKKKVTTSKNVHKRNATVVYVE